MKRKTIVLSELKLGFVTVIVFLLFVPSYQLKESYQYEKEGVIKTANATSTYNMERKNNLSVPYFRTTIPMRIYECLREFSVLRCTKLFVLQKMEERKSWINTGNITKDFIAQFFDDNDQLKSLVSTKYHKMSENELDKKLVINFKRFFKNRDIKVRLLPGLLVKVVPSKKNKLKFSLKKKITFQHESRSQVPSVLGSVLKDNVLVDGSLEAHDSASLDEDDIDGKSKNKIVKKKPKKDKDSYKTTILQMAVPVMIMPAILIGTFLPFILPVLKMATLTTMIMNNTAFMAALIYAARQHVNAQDEQHINYSYGAHQGNYN